MKSAVLAASISFALVAIARPSDGPPPAPPVNYEKKDDAGRLMSRVTFHPDGAITHLAFVYGPEAEKLTLEEELDAKRDVVRTLREKVDRRGRPVEREEMTMVEGRRVTRQTKFKYDAQGRQTAETHVIE